MPYQTFTWMGKRNSEIGVVATELLRPTPKPRSATGSRAQRKTVVESAQRLLREMEAERMLAFEMVNRVYKQLPLQEAVPAATATATSTARVTQPVDDDATDGSTHHSVVAVTDRDEGTVVDAYTHHDMTFEGTDDEEVHLVPSDNDSSNEFAEEEAVDHVGDVPATGDDATFEKVEHAADVPGEEDDDDDDATIEEGPSMGSASATKETTERASIPPIESSPRQRMSPQFSQRMLREVQVIDSDSDGE